MSSMPQANKISLHVEAVNLARRYTVQNENDLMQVRVDILMKDIFLTREETERKFMISMCPYLFAVTSTATT
jgi:hypothetical protein